VLLEIARAITSANENGLDRAERSWLPVRGSRENSAWLGPGWINDNRYAHWEDIFDSLAETTRIAPVATVVATISGRRYRAIQPRP